MDCEEEYKYFIANLALCETHSNELEKIINKWKNEANYLANAQEIGIIMLAASNLIRCPICGDCSQFDRVLKRLEENHKTILKSEKVET